MAEEQSLVKAAKSQLITTLDLGSALKVASAGAMLVVGGVAGGPLGSIVMAGIPMLFIELMACIKRVQPEEARTKARVVSATVSASREQNNVKILESLKDNRAKENFESKYRAIENVVNSHDPIEKIAWIAAAVVGDSIVTPINSSDIWLATWISRTPLHVLLYWRDVMHECFGPKEAHVVTYSDMLLKYPYWKTPDEAMNGALPKHPWFSSTKEDIASLGKVMWQQIGRMYNRTGTEVRIETLPPNTFHTFPYPTELAVALHNVFVREEQVCAHMTKLDHEARKAFEKSTK